MAQVCADCFSMSKYLPCCYYTTCTFTLFRIVAACFLCALCRRHPLTCPLPTVLRSAVTGKSAPPPPLPCSCPSPFSQRVGKGWFLNLTHHIESTWEYSPRLIGSSHQLKHGQIMISYDHLTLIYSLIWTLHIIAVIVSVRKVLENKCLILSCLTTWTLSSSE